MLVLHSSLHGRCDAAATGDEMDSGHTLRSPARAPLVAIVASLLLIVGAPTAYAHFNDWDSVDGGEIRYEDNTQWDGARTWSIDRWNGLGSVDILPDSATTVADLEIKDYSANDGLCGKAGPRTGADNLSLNSSNFQNYNYDQRKACVLHEFGHTLRLEHSYADQVMDACPVCTTYYTYPQGHDISDYRQVWG